METRKIQQILNFRQHFSTAPLSIFPPPLLTQTRRTCCTESLLDQVKHSVMIVKISSQQVLHDPHCVSLGHCLFNR